MENNLLGHGKEDFAIAGVRRHLTTDFANQG
jgi:hypothetical protein